MIPDKVIVTIKDEKGNSCGDYELPASVPVGKYKQQLAELLAKKAPQVFSPYNTQDIGLFYEEDGQFYNIPDKDTLANHSIWDGRYVYVRNCLTE